MSDFSKNLSTYHIYPLPITHKNQELKVNLDINVLIEHEMTLKNIPAFSDNPSTEQLSPPLLTQNNIDDSLSVAGNTYQSSCKAFQ